MTKWEEDHPAARYWIYNLDTTLAANYEKYSFDDYLGFYETIYNLKINNAIDDGIVYELFSNGLENQYEANNFELRRLIGNMRKEENDPEIYMGVERLYHDFKSKRKYITK